MAPIRQASFLGGVVNPRLYGRTDLPRYGQALRRLENFVVTPQGALENRAGFEYLGPTKYPSTPGTEFRLIPFIYSDAQSYVLEVSPLTLRVWSYGEQVESSPGVAYEVDDSGVGGTAFGISDFRDLKFVQVGDVLCVCGNDFQVYELRRNGNADWTLELVDFSSASPYFSSNPAFSSATLVAEDSTHPLKEWVYMVSQIRRVKATGQVYETTAFRVTEQISNLGVNPPARRMTSS